MEGGNSCPRAGPDRLAERGGVPRRNSGGVFTWLSPLPSPDVVAGLERAFPEVIQLPSEAIVKETEDWSSSGVIVRPLSRWIPADAMLREFRRAGIAGSIDFIALAHRTFLVKFELPEARSAALLQPWIVNGQPLAMEPWRSDFVPAEDGVQSALLWIRLPNLPIEYWSEQTLRSILSVAGHYVEADVFTKEKRRGSFARACVRVDLGKPLRPGARIRALGAPFWQQFVFEHVDCICSSCGSLHSAGSCSIPPQPGASAVPPLFGPWMAALRQRKLPPAHRNEGSNAVPAVASDLKGKGIVSGQEAKEGWSKPGKVSRRKTVPPSSSSNVAFVHAVMEEEGVVSREATVAPVENRGGDEARISNVPITIHPKSVIIKQAVPITVHPLPENSSECLLPVSSHAKSQVNSRGRRVSLPPRLQSDRQESSVSEFQFKAKAPVLQSQSPDVILKPGSHVNLGVKLTGACKVAVNPFALVGSDRNAGCPKSREDVNPVTSKRARPIEGNGVRILSKGPKGKGRQAPSGKGPTVGTDPRSSGLPQANDDHELATQVLKEALLDSPTVSRGEGPISGDQSDEAPWEPIQQSDPLDQHECQMTDQGFQGLCPDLVDNVDQVMEGVPDGA